MFDGFDAGFDIAGFGVADLGLSGLGFDGLGFGDFGGIDGFDPTMAAFGGMTFDGMAALDGVDLGDLGTSSDFGLDLSFDTLGFGSDLDDVVLAPDMGALIDLDLAQPFDGGSIVDSPVDLSPLSVPDLSPAAAIGMAPFASPFVPFDPGVAAVAGGATATGATAGVFLPGGLINTPTDRYAFPAATGGRVVRNALPWLRKKSMELADDLAKEAVGKQVKRGAAAIFAVVSGADNARQP